MIEVDGVPQGRLSHSDAQADCESRGGRLAILNTAEKQAAAVAVVPAGWAAWIGGGDTDGDCTHHWSDGTEVPAPGTSTAENFENWHGNPQCGNPPKHCPTPGNGPCTSHGCLVFSIADTWMGWSCTTAPAKFGGLCEGIAPPPPSLPSPPRSPPSPPSPPSFPPGLSLWVTSTTGTYDEMQAACVARDAAAHLVVPVTDAERLAAIAAVEASSHIPDPEGDVDFWVGYRLPKNSDPSSETNYDGENGQTMEQVGYWQWYSNCGKCGNKKNWNRCVHHRTAGGATPGYYMETCSGPYPGVCQLGVRPPPPAAPPAPPLVGANKITPVAAWLSSTYDQN